MSDFIKKIADLLTDDPDIFNEMATSTGAIAMGPGMGLPVRSRKKKKVVSDDSEDGYEANKVTGQPKKGEMIMGSKEHKKDDEDDLE